MGLVNDRSLMQPFLPGSPVGRGSHGDGEAQPITNERWAQAFPDCPYNKNLTDSTLPQWSYEDYVKSKLANTGANA
jgi:hypothetical protein